MNTTITGTTLPQDLYKGKIEVREITLEVKPVKSFKKALSEEAHKYDALHEQYMNAAQEERYRVHDLKYRG